MQDRQQKSRLAGLLVCAAVGSLTLACEALPDPPNTPPLAAFVYSPVSPIIAGETSVSFNASGSRDSDGSIGSYTFNFGDGTPEVSGGSPVVAHVFPDTYARCTEVVYSVLLTVTDDKNDTTAVGQQVHVIELPDPKSTQCEKER